MDGTHFSLRTSSSFLLLLIFLHSSTAEICSTPILVNIAENNEVGVVVSTIHLEPGVTVNFTADGNPDNMFRIVGNTMEAAKVLDFEDKQVHAVSIICTETATASKLELPIVVSVDNLNDNAPVFEQNPYHATVNELSPSGTTVGRFAATDLDGGPLYYTLMPESSGFALKAPTNPDLLVVTPVDFDKVKSVQLILIVQDAPLTAANSRAPFSATTTIMVYIVDVDNRPPWFQPCSRYEVGGAVVCQSNGYTSRVVLNEQEAEVLSLDPGPLYAIDGDLGLDEEITYSFLGGDGGGLFQINPSTGNISMLKPVDVLGTISLTVLAAQSTNLFQSSSTSLSIRVQVKSLHPPQLQRSQYRGVVSTVGSMAIDPENKDQPLRFLATDQDYNATGGINPHITYSVKGSSDFSIIDGYLFMTKDLPEGTLSLQVVAVDSTNEESDTAQLSVQVTSGLTTTSLPDSTTDRLTTALQETTEETTSTPNPTDSSLSPSVSDPTSSDSLPTESTAHPPTVIVPGGGFGAVDMAALGASLGVLLFVCLVVIVVLAVRVRRGKADWRKIAEASLFQSSLGQKGQKEGIQYTNEAFQKDEDEDGGSTGGGGGLAARGSPQYEEILKPSVALNVLRDDTSEAGSDKTDNEKEVKPILTKERRLDEGYKSVWFKEDVDPDAKEEVVIIPDSREDDSEEEEQEEEEKMKTPRVMFDDADLDSGLGVKMEDPGEDSEDDEELTVDL
ncbi:cadherin-related family member 5-like [Gymnodraco acuticeps]|uniref:Cadherin-related family member 5-like n=1 Tax=Gymnodraco acuticeps TaxID=8218 RepID=A0A6P8X347_GYMAC|nr:cadherin-related family member 5-like [Gymnodraco acuticeps]